MNTLEAIIRLQKIEEKISNEQNLSSDCLQTLINEFESIKNKLLQSNFAFDSVKKLIYDTEKKIKMLQ